MALRPFMAQLLAGRLEREHRAMAQQDERTHEAVRHARELRDERTAQIRLTETRDRTGGWRG